MAFVGVSDDFDLDDDGILRDSMSGAGLLIDDEGILRDDSLDMYKHVVRGHWTDSGFSGDKQSSTSTLQHLQNSFEEDLAPIGDESINISEFEASKDDLSFERQDETYAGNERKRVKSLLSLGLLDTMESTLDKPQDFEDEPPSKQNRMVSGSMNQNSVDFNNTTADFDNQRFPPEYYKELRELGVLVDGADLTRDSLDDFDGTESKLEDEQNRENEDLIAEYLESEYRREKEEEEEEGKTEEGIKTRRENAFRRSHESGVMADAFSRPSSAQTISSRSFPDDVDDYGNEIMSQNLGSQSQKTTGEDEEIFNITSRILPTSPADVLRGKSDQLRRSSYSSKSGKDSSNNVLNKNTSYQGATTHSRGSTPGFAADNHHPYDEDARSVYSEAAPLRSRPSSTTSHFSTASEIVSARQKKAEEAAVQRMSKARSQESFFEGEQSPTNSGEKTQHKRLLPTMSSSEPTHSTHSFKLKSKSVSNIASKAGPVKPTHMTVMEISRLTNMENPAPLPWEDNHTTKLEQDDELPGELSTRLTQEAQKRKQATELVQQLQKDYDNLLTKYALAELTIDQMRLGAKITLHTDSPTPGQAQSRIMSPIPPGQSAQMVSVRQSPSQAVKLPGHGVLGQVSPLADVADHVDGRHPLMSDQRSRSRPDLLKSGLSSLRQSVAENEDGLQEVPELVTETVKTDMLMQAKDMDDRLESFYTLLEQRQLTFEEQEQVFEKIKTDHDVLRRAYLQAKDDYNVLRRSGAITTDVQNFDQNKELEGQLFRLGMRFDEVQERVEKNLKERPVQRQPFSSDNSNRLEDEKKKGKDHKTDPKDDNDGKGGGKVASGQIKHLNTSRTTSVESTDDHIFERRAQELREEYNSKMDAYRKLKFLASTPEGEKQVESVVRRLNEICTEMPEMFRLSPEIQDRWEKLNRREQEVKSQRRSPVPQLSRDGRSTVSSGRSTGSSGRGSDMADSESLRAPLDVSGRSSLGSILPDRFEHPSPRGRHGPSSNGIYNTERPSSRGSNHGYEPGRTPSRPRSTAGDDNSFADSSYYGQDSSNPNLPRPRRHAHELRDPRLSKMPDMGSSHHLPDSMAPGQSNLSSSFNARGQHGGPRGSESGAAVGGTGGGGGGATSRGTGDDAEGALAALPGPGKFKQMTKQRAADDADSGFIGSMVGSGVGEPPALIQQQEEQQQLALRLRQQADDSSTITDQSFSTSTQGSERSSDKHHKASREGSRPQRKSRGSGGSRGDASYDGEGETLESLDSGSSSKKGRVTKPAKLRDRRKEEKSNVSSSATFEEGSTAESDASTPRATSNQSSGKVKEKQTAGQQAPTSVSRPASRTQTVAETRAGAQAETQTVAETRAGAQAETTDSKSKTKPGVTEGQQTSEKESSGHQTQARSAAAPLSAPPSRPSSRGSPTTDLYQTRSRRTSVESGRGGRAGPELSRHERELRQERAELRNTRLSLHAQGRLTDSTSAPPPLVLPPDPRNSEIARRVKEYEERSVGSDVEVGSSITTRASSVNSSIRLKALQEEVEKLKAGFAKANERASQPPPPPQIVHVPGPPLPSAERKQEPEYYDPFDDPYGFMRMPRRRANSFSGGRERDWDEWYWTLPQNRQYDGGDIPLGYAAADAYAEHPRVPIVAGRERNTKENVKNRMRQKRLERKHRGDVPPTELDAGGVGAETVQQPSPGAAGLVEEQPAALYDYYLPSRYSAQAMRQQMASRGYFTTPSGGKIYSSTGEEADNEEERGVLSDTAYLAGSASPAQSRPWYQIRRAARPFASAYVGQGEPRAQSHDDLRYEPGNPSSPYINQQARATAHATNNTTTASQACPMCGVSSYHAHANFVHTGFTAPRTSPPKYSSHTFDRDSTPTRHSRPRSRSASRTRSYTPDSRSRYSVREYSPLSDSDGEEQTPRRSRSLSRGRTRDRSRPRREAHRHKRRSESASDLSDEEVALDRSLSLSMDISRLTHKMLGTLRVELKRSSEKRDYGSSYW